MLSAPEADVVSLTDFHVAPGANGRSKVIGMSVRRLRLQANRTYALVSASGRGKSVFLSLLSGFAPSSWRGQMTWTDWKMFGETIPHLQKPRRTPFPLFPVPRRNALIYLPQSFPQDRAEGLTTLEAMAFVLCASDRSRSLREAKRQVEELVSEPRFNLHPSMLHQPIHQLSGGERRRVELLTRLEAICPRGENSRIGDSRQALILLDEPTTGLDILNESEFIHFLSDLHRIAAARGIGLAILVATHAFTHLSAQLSYFDEVLVLDRDEPGHPRNPPSMIRLVFQGALPDVFRHFAQFTEPDQAEHGWREIIQILEITSSDLLECAFYGGRQP